MELCRVCLSSDVFKDLAQMKSHAGGQRKNGLEIFMFCIDIDIKPADNSPKTCLKCYRKLLAFYKFKLLALKNNYYYGIHTKRDDYEHNLSGKKDDFIEPQFESNIETPDVASRLNFNIDVKIDEYNLAVKEENDTLLEDQCENDISSDNELLSVLSTHKLENNLNDEVKENVPLKRKRGRPKKILNNLLNSKSKGKETQICEECGKSVKNLKHHLMSHIPMADKKVVPCKLCSKTFTTYGAKYRHNKIKHLGVKKLCGICNKQIVNLEAHMLIKHRKEELKYECMLCQRRFYCKSFLEIHTRSHTNTRPFECDECRKYFRTKATLTNHIRNVHIKEKSHLCQFCSKVFYTKEYLKNHLRIHTKEKPYVCNHCGKTFRTGSQRNKHQMLHTGVKKYPCTHCDMAFYTNSALSTHMVSHTKERRYGCQYCGVRFGRSDHKLRHERTAHEKHIL